MSSRTESWRRRLWFGAGLAALVCLATMAAVGASIADASIQAKPTLSIATNTEITSLDAFTLGNAYPPSNSLVWEGLVIPQPNGTNAPGLATSFHFLKSPPNSLRQNKDFALTLRKGARFADGSPLTAKGVKTWFDFVNSENLRLSGASGANLAWGVPVSSVQVTGKYTLVVHFESPNAGVWDRINAYAPIGRIESPACVANRQLFNTGNCSAGPYKYDPSRSTVGSDLTLAPNPYFYAKSEQHWGQIDEKLITVPSTALQALQAGQIDVVMGDYSTAAAAKASGFYVSESRAREDNLTLLMNYNIQPAFQKLQVRQALNYAIDRNALSKAFGNGLTIPTSLLWTKDGGSEKARNYYSYNPVKAKQLLAAAGYPNGFSFSAFSWDPWGSTGTPLMQAVAKYFSAVGVTMNITPGDGTTYGNYATKVAMAEVPLGVNYFSTYWGLFYQPNAPLNSGVYAGPFVDPVMNKLYYSGSRKSNPAAYYQQISLRGVEQAYFVPVLIRPYLFFANSKKVNIRTGNSSVVDPTEWTLP